MKRILNFDSFIKEELTMADEPLVAPKQVPSPSPKTTPSPTPTKRPRPSRPGVTPTHIPSEKDAPMAYAEDVIKRLEDIYNDLDNDEKEEINIYFKNK
ncbi:MAG: hypothetical protein M0R46_06930 [Candidatus Muirbacterium halophilum]|nr:hypothetical protein [Candidatus Muirbacterium halophilum]